jgi:hypothetical protein
VHAKRQAGLESVGAQVQLGAQECAASPLITPDGPPQFRVSSDEPSPFVDIELHQAFVSHFQQEGLASFLIHDIGAFHDLVDFEWLSAQRAQDIFSIIQHD